MDCIYFKVLAQTEKTTTLESLVDEDNVFTYNLLKPQHLPKTSLQDKIKSENHKIQPLSPKIIKALDKLPSLEKLTEIHQENENKLSGSAENVDRTHLKDILFGEYTLEEVIYQLAKTMFTQSLNNGSKDSQAALQKLTQFLEIEGKQGRISPILEKKVLGKN